MKRDNETGHRVGARWTRVVGVAVLGLVGLAGCDVEGLVQLDDPDLITLPVVQDTANIESVRNGALFEFARAMTGPAGNNQTPGIIGISGVFTDELWYASTFDGMKDLDRRSHLDTNGHVGTVYAWLHRARNLAGEAEALYADSRPDSDDRSLLVNLEAFTYVLFAETFCSGVPFGRAPLGQPLEYEPGISTTEMLNEAITRFDEATSLAQGNSDYVNLARVGRARALLDLGQMGEAADEAAQVPDGWDYAVTYSSNSASQNNGVWYNVNSEVRSSASTNEGINGLAFFTRGPSGSNDLDPRISVDSAGVGLGTMIPHYSQFAYPDRGADVVLASGTEARLIEAEADLNGGQTPGSSTAGNWLRILNDLRTDVELEPLTDPGNADDRVTLLFDERAKWLWLTAHRMGDLRRLVRQYGFDQADVFPIGTTIFGTPYGDDVVFLIPDNEDNNPEFTGCIDRNA